jgi:hypothetical protein
MREHYDGPGETAKKLARSEAELKTIHYRNEQGMTFESYVNKLNELFFVFAEAKQPLTPDQKVKHLCDKINTSNTKLETAMTVIKMEVALKVPPEEYFVKAANSLAEQIVTIFPHATKARASRYVSFAGRGRSGGRGGGRGGRSTRGGQRGDFPPGLGGNPGDTWNGHDISGLTKFFPGNVFQAFPQALKSKIHTAKQANRGGGSQHGGNHHIDVVEMNDTSTQVSTMADEMTEVRAVMQASRDNENTSTAGASAASAFGRPGFPPAYKKQKTGQ